jgi:mannose-6-phosphate isomerase-like protein (cupin superfamily)
MTENPLGTYLRSVDMAAFDATPPQERRSQRLIDADSGATSCQISYIKTPPGGGSPRGLHTHSVDQHFYVLSGVMQIEVDGHTFAAPAGSMVYFPAGMPHKNWNEGDVPTIHLSINSPLPEPGVPMTTSLG